ncbi:MAG: OmpA family protein [Myxococcales bacterium]|nr:OmpA family protein [Myxococcales bacterium]
MKRALAALLLLVAGGAVARADGFQLERYEPTPAGSWFLAVPHPWYSSTRYFAAGLTLDYGHNPLLGGLFEPGFRQTVAIVEHQLVGHVDVAGSFLDRVQLSLSLPVVLMERGTPAFGAAPIGGAAVGDPRVGVMVRLWGQADRSPISIHAGGYVWIPVGVTGSHAGDDNARGMPEVVLAGMLKDHVRWSLDAGVLVRAHQTFGFGPANSADSELRLGLAAAWTNHARSWSVGPELTLGSAIDGPRAGKKYGTALELLVGGQYHIKHTVLVGAGIGSGLASLLGTPDVRVIFRAAYAPVRTEKPAGPPDADHDGIPDAEDLCPQTPGASTAKGCPDADRDGVPDAEDLCPQKSGVTTARGCPDADADGVPDGEDLCPGARSGTKPDPDKKGCPLDSDADGIPDAEDLCPNAKPGDQPDPAQKGCPADADHDGVPDADDLCPGDAPGAHPDSARKGCPQPDADHDGVPDAEDACPKDVGDANSTDPKTNGCPKLMVQSGAVFELRSVHFETNKWELLPESFPILDEVARALNEHQEYDKVVVEGHADDRGTHEWNLRLSRHRAQSVVEYLAKKGVRRGRLSYEGYGDTKPLDPERNDEARAKNRRVEVRVSSTKKEPARK